jgi:hypothetical protein
MRMNELVEVYEATRRRAKRLTTWHLRLWAWRSRRALRRDRNDQTNQVRLVAIEHELVVRGALACPTFPTRPAPARPRRARRRR